VSVNCLCLERASLWDFVVLAVVFVVSFFFFFLFTGCWLESSVRVFSFFREVFVLFSFKFRSSFAPAPEGSILSYLYNAWQVFLALVGITVHVCRKDVVLTCNFCKNHTFFVFLASDSISQPHGEGDFAIHYTIDMQLLGSLALLFCFVYKCGCFGCCCFCCFFFSFFLQVVG
jgi:hypothetical protein